MLRLITRRGFFAYVRTGIFADESSFQCVTCVSDGGFIEDMEIKQGDSFFVPAGYGNYHIKGKLVVIITKISTDNLSMCP